MKIIIRYSSFVLITLILIIIYCCEKAENKSEPQITCSAGCSTMKWEIIGETGQRTYEETCDLDWIGNNYIETCTGTVEYEVSGRTYSYTVIYDWIDCEIDVTVSGKGSCSDRTAVEKSGDCNCRINTENAYIKYKYE